MAIYYQYGEAVDVVGYQEDGTKFRLVVRYPTGRCLVVGIEDLRADDGLRELEQAYRTLLGWSPWDRNGPITRMGSPDQRTPAVSQEGSDESLPDPVP